MNIAGSSLFLLLLGSVSASPLLAQPHAREGLQPVSETLQVAGNTLPADSRPGNDTIRRINPNSRQGSVPATPPVRGPSTAPAQRQPSIENGAIGNGYPRNPPLPETLKPTAPSLQPRDKR
ncbi:MULTISPECIES: hypothetical protein [Pseudomonas]|uniref:hypothetical protein n=1 Tax=Pseudomonas TaxID=286 RepID=UPI00103B9915|nr:hypothetical protein [Pseudomonas sp. D1HM]